MSDPSAPAKDLVPRPLLVAERESAWHAANFHGASRGHRQPVALWILGPSAVGKSTLTMQAGRDFGIPVAVQELGADCGEACQRLDAVIIDGEFVRDAHAVWQRWVKTSDWRAAYPALKSLINKEKDAMCTEAASLRKHLVIPQTMLNLEKGLTEVEELMWQGYTNHVLAVVATLEDCRRRGRSRELTTGKRYNDREFELSISAIPPMIENCNGRFQVIQATEVDGCERRMDFRVLAHGCCGSCAATAFNANDLRAVIAAAVGSSRGPDTSLAIAKSRMHPVKLAQRAVSSPPLGSLKPRPLSGDERRHAWTLANFYAATQQENPIALWILGPPSVGKSTLASKLGERFGIPLRKGSASGSDHLDAVMIDGEFMRKTHDVWRNWMKMPDWQAADHAMKSMLNKEKDQLCTEAATQRKHLVIGRRLLDLQKGLTEIAELAYQGYTNHVAGLVAPVEECQRRGRQREQARGKRYEPNEFERALASIPLMACACNGRFEVIRPIELQRQEHEMDLQVLLSGSGGHQAVKDAMSFKAAEVNAAHLRGRVASAIHQTVRASGASGGAGAH